MKKSTAKVINTPETKDVRIDVPLSCLVLSPHNVRKGGATNLEELAAMLLSQDVLQNLTVHAVKKKGSRATPTYAVAAGGRRLAALKLLVSRKMIAPDYPVPCLVVSEERAIEVSIAENSHEPMHPADEFEAFRDMIGSGKPIEDVAAAFGVTPLTVKRRLRLANVSPRLFALYREDEATLDQLMALGVTDDQTAQEQAWDSLPEYGRQPHVLRRCLTEKEVDVKHNPLALWVGIDAYEGAGGQVRRDLFSETNGGFLRDLPLLESLALAKLHQAAETITAEGWEWVEVRTSCDYETLSDYGRAGKTKREPTAEEQTRLGQLAEEQGIIEEELADFEGDDDEKDQRLAVLYDEELAIKDTLFQYVDEKHKCGAIVSLNYQGELAIHRGLIRPEDKPTSSPKGNGAAGAGSGKTKAVHSESLIRMLTAQRTAALQASLATRPDVALAAVVGNLVSHVFRDLRYSNIPLQISIKESGLVQDCPDIEQSCARIELNAQRMAWLDRFPQGDERNIFAWLLDQPQETLLALLAFCAACSVDTVQSREGKAMGAAALGDALALDMADWWEATPDAYFSHVNKSRLVDVVTEAVSAEAAKPLVSMKKPDAVKAAALHLEGLRWLPSPLRVV